MLLDATPISDPSSLLHPRCVVDPTVAVLDGQCFRAHASALNGRIAKYFKRPPVWIDDADLEASEWVHQDLEVQF